MRLIVCCMITLLYFSIMADYIQNQDRRTSMTVTDNLYGDIVLMSVVCDVANSPLLHLYISHGHASLIAMFRGLLPAFLILRIIWCRSFVWPDVFLVSKCRYHYLNLNLSWVPDKRTLLSSCQLIDAVIGFRILLLFYRCFFQVNLVSWFPLRSPSSSSRREPLRIGGTDDVDLVTHPSVSNHWGEDSTNPNQPGLIFLCPLLDSWQKGHCYVYSCLTPVRAS